MEKQLSDLTVIELKALAYDQLAQLELSQNNLKILNQELSKRLNSNPQVFNPIIQRDVTAVEPIPPGSIQQI